MLLQRGVVMTKAGVQRNLRLVRLQQLGSAERFEVRVWHNILVGEKEPAALPRNKVSDEQLRAG